jgi:predicted DNA-binding WGR domain protein
MRRWGAKASLAFSSSWKLATDPRQRRVREVTVSEQRTLLHERLEWYGANAGNKSGKSDKFWDITVSTNGGNTFTVTRWYGRYGTKGQRKVKEHWSELAALSEARSLIRKKRDKGYTSPVAPLTRLASVADEDD